ncbi:MAG: LytTR family transcriptional regulator DNA-binding domain-containing protein [Bacteroidia bacterium]
MSASVGDFSKDVPIPEELDEFSELYVGIQLIVEVAREKIAVLEKNRQEIDQGTHANNLLVVKTDGRLLRINPEEIIFIQALKDYMAIYTKDRRYITHNTMKGMLPN